MKNTNRTTAQLPSIEKPTYKRFIDLEDEVYGRLTVVQYAGKNSRGRPQWLCKCSCGNLVECLANSLRLNDVKSCGCLNIDRITKHGGSKHPLYSTYKGMRERCYNKKHKHYKDYGGRGITICDRWQKDFWAFVEDLEERPEGATIDRIDNNKDYNPDNVRWATKEEQAQNVRTNSLTFQQATQIQHLYYEGLKVCKIHSMYFPENNYMAIYKCAKAITWKNVTIPDYYD